MQELDGLQMKSQLEGAGLGLPLQGGAQGHNPGNRQPRREDAFCEGAEGKHTYSSIEREGHIRSSRSQPRCRQLEDRGPALPGDLSWHLLRGLSQVALRHGLDQEAGSGPPRGPEHWGSVDFVRYCERETEAQMKQLWY